MEIPKAIQNGVGAPLPWNDMKVGDEVLVCHTRFMHFLHMEVLAVDRLRNCVMVEFKVIKCYSSSGTDDWRWEHRYKHIGIDKRLRWKRIPEIEAIYRFSRPLTAAELAAKRLAERAAERKMYSQYRHVLTTARDELSEALKLLGITADIQEDEFRRVVRTIMLKYHPDRAILVERDGGDVKEFTAKSNAMTQAISLVRDRLFISIRKTNADDACINETQHN